MTHYNASFTGPPGGKARLRTALKLMGFDDVTFTESAAPEPLPKAETPKPAKGVTEGAASGMVPTTAQSKRFAAIYHRKLTTPWQPNEVAAYKKIGIVPEDELAAVERYYAANWPPDRENNILRHDLITFLNNFQGEVGRAQAEKQKPKAGRALEWTPANVVPMQDLAEAERIRLATLAQIAAHRRAQE